MREVIVYKSCFYLTIIYQSNGSFNIPSPGQPLGIWILGKFLFKSPLPGPKSGSNPFRVIKCLHPRENYQIAVLTFH